MLSSQVVVACHGGPGTVSEIALALKCACNVVLLGWDSPASDFPSQVAAGSLLTAATPEQARDLVQRLLPTV